MLDLTVIILTKNEEENIGPCIQSASFADEILVIDSGSTDRTRELAEAAGARVILHSFGEEGFAGQRNFALTQTTAKWVFYLDADERMMEEVRTSIEVAIADPAPMTYDVLRQNIVFGHAMHYGAHRPDRCCRLFPRTAVRWVGRVHERPETVLATAHLDGMLQHRTYETWTQYFTKLNQYTSLAAKESFALGKRASKSVVLGHALFALFREYVLRGGFLDGFYGLVMSVTAGIYRMTKYLKLMNLERLARPAVKS
ncbi:MAG: glycosyltransferase family 2 protein [Selenomonas sp.]|nr:glycosyltransferase family 2 protein [Selenomonas sp.]